MAQEQIRIFLDQKFIVDEIIEIEQQLHYLINVMRVKKSDEIIVFNGTDGDWMARIEEASKRKCIIELIKQVKSQDVIKQRISLAFCLIKNQTISDIAKQATELGIAEFYPIISERVAVNSFNEKRFLINIIEASEQCKRNSLPKINKISSLNDFIENTKDKVIIVADESGKGQNPIILFKEIQKNFQNQEIIILIGPEGGFAPFEFEIMQKNNLFHIGLGNTILKSPTACVAAIAILKAILEIDF